MTSREMTSLASSENFRPVFPPILLFVCFLAVLGLRCGWGSSWFAGRRLLLAAGRTSWCCGSPVAERGSSDQLY